MPVQIAATEPDPTERPLRTPPPGDGVMVRFSEMAPDAESPMHRTQTLDVGVVIEGETWLLLDDGSETRVLRGTPGRRRGLPLPRHRPRGAREHPRVMPRATHVR
jgi:hypothetical protein